jgi:Helix-turn-helix domain
MGAPPGIRAVPPLMVDIETAARALSLSRSTGYELARQGQFPCRVLHVGSSYRVPTIELLRILGMTRATRS